MWHNRVEQSILLGVENVRMDVIMTQILFVSLSVSVFALIYFIAYIAFNEYIPIAIENAKKMREMKKNGEIPVPMKVSKVKSKTKNKVIDENDFTISHDGTLTSYLGENMNLVIPNTVRGITVEHIGERFYFNFNGELPKLKSVVIPSTVKTIGGYSFWGNELKKVVIPEGVTSIGDWSFRFNNLTKVHLPVSLEILGYDAFSYNQIKKVRIPPHVKVWEEKVFLGNPLKSLLIPEFLHEKVDSSREMLAKSVVHYDEETDTYTYDYFTDEVIKYYN